MAQDEQQPDQRFMIGDEDAFPDPGNDFVFRRPFNGLDFFFL